MSDNHNPGAEPASLTPEYFTQAPAVLAALQELHGHLKTKSDWRVSDVTDGEESAVADATDEETGEPYTYPRRYVDLVMEGGGMLGIALVGYVYALEQVGIRFLRLGGTSAGSINAMLMAAAGPRHEPSTEWIIGQLANQNFYEFVDGDRSAREFTREMLEPDEKKKGLVGWLTGVADKADLIGDGLRIVDNLRDDFGLHRGKVFEDWLTDLLEAKQIHTIQQLIDLRSKAPKSGLRCTHDAADQALPVPTPYQPADLFRVAIVAADITTQTKVVFPEMAPLYWGHWEGVQPAKLVRASMSIPLFFQPYRRTPIPGSREQDQAYRDAWNALGYTGDIPKSVLFMDGGIMSNFPIDLFHDHLSVPAAPTFGVKLGIDRNAARPNKSLLQVLGAMFDAARTQYDFDFIHRNPDYRHLVHCINVDGFNWLDFNMSNEAKLGLFVEGVQGAVNFLQKFDWAEYKQLRAQKVPMVAKSKEMDADKARLKSPAADRLRWPGDLRPSYMKAAAATNSASGADLAPTANPAPVVDPAAVYAPPSVN